MFISKSVALYSNSLLLLFIQDAPNMADNAFTLFYGKFRANAPRVKPLTEQVESRLDKGPE